jgi:2-polyprenyl-3-methyl-5-hydroxy-6-metoxy-1,4-benzoquinol methylase
MRFIGGTVGYRLLKWIAPREESLTFMDGSAYAQKSKLEVLLGRRFFDDIQGQTVIDFGCGTGGDAIEMAQRGARRVIGVDIRQSFLDTARQRAIDAGLADRCIFVTTPDEPADVVVSLDSFEHFADPPEILRVMERYLTPTGRVVVSFGPPWFHPRGGHLFSVFPWAHLVFSDAAFLRWRKDFRPHQIARTVTECGLNMMTVSRFERLVANSAFRFEHYEARPIRGVRWFKAPLLREIGTSTVTCTLTRRSATTAPAGSRPSRRESPCTSAA